MRSLIILVPALLGGLVFADHVDDKNRKPAMLWSGMGKHHHPVSTTSAEAQKFFDQGLTFIYAFNHHEAIRSFERAAELDPNLAMAWWGAALARGPNYNLDADESALKAAYAALEKAITLAEKAPEHEKDYVQAVAKRYPADPKMADKAKLAVVYKDAMGELSRKYPDDLDAATLYAESMMNLRPWKLWSPDGKPAEGTLEILSVLESVLQRNPDHPGANHYYIHAIEASPNPERGLACAERLRNLVPAAGHLVHMPAHIYMRVGNYNAAALANEQAIRADQAYFFASGVKGVYPMMYYSHNIHFLAFARAMEGRMEDAQRAADQLADHVSPHIADMPMLEGFLLAPMLVDVRFHQWADILSAKIADEKLRLTRAITHFARGLAFLQTGKLEDAVKEHTAFMELKKAIPADAMASDLNKAQDVLKVAEAYLEGKLAATRGDQSAAEKALRRTIEAEDALNYAEPADWQLPVREALGALLLRAGNGAAAESVFRDELRRSRRSGRALFGLREALKAQGKDQAARLIDLEFQAAWRNAVPKGLRLEDF